MVSMKKSNADHQAAYAKRQKAAGRTQRKIWAHQEDWERIREFVARLNSERENANSNPKE